MSPLQPRCMHVWMLLDVIDKATGACLSVVAEEQVAAERVAAIDDVGDLRVLLLRVLHLSKQQGIIVELPTLAIELSATSCRL